MSFITPFFAFLATQAAVILVGLLTGRLIKQFETPPSQLHQVVIISTAMALFLVALGIAWTRLQGKLKRRPVSRPLSIPPRLPVDMAILAATVSLVPLTIACAAAVFPFTEASAALRWELIPVSLWCIACAAFIEEFLNRRILLGGLLRAANQRPVYCAMAIGIQAAIFSACHGVFAFITTGHFLFYFLGGCMLGWTYWIYQNVWLTTAIHLIMNLSVAQTGPIRYWFAGRVAQFAGDAWHDWFVIGAACLLGIQLLTLPFRNKKGRDTSRPWYEEARG